jgi:hypothetical protein
MTKSNRGECQAPGGNKHLLDLVLSVDEKPSTQALERATGYVETDSGKIVQGFKSTYKRHGALNLFDW